jgi:hypothetical protein
MKMLAVLWDPANPLVPVDSVLGALKSRPDLHVMPITFAQIGHPTLPNGAFDLRPAMADKEPDGILWIEGGPLPRDLADFSCPKACWLVNTHLEPTLVEDVAKSFDVVFSASLADTELEKAVWLPLAPAGAGFGSPPAGVSLLVDDPRPAEHAQLEATLGPAVQRLETPPVPVVVVLGNGGRVHPALYDCLLSGAAVVTSPDCDLRGLAHAGEHLEVYPSQEAVGDFVRTLAKDPERLRRLSERGPAIVHHLHEPALRAERICQGLWPSHEVLSGRDHRPRISILVTCYRYLRRLRVCLESLARQELPPGALEIVVADPGSPDGLEGALRDFAARYPGIRTVRLPLDSRYHRNRGVGINRAFDASTGTVVIGIDGDLVFPPKLVGLLEERVLASPGQVFGVRRVFVGKDDTESILSGTLDPFENFERLANSDGDGEKGAFVGVLGYCQAVRRDAFSRARYPEEFDAVNQSDIVFVERLKTWANVTPQYLQDQPVLHLWHPRNWAGTSEDL